MRVCVFACVNVQDHRVGCLGMSHHGSMFPFSSVGTPVFLLADLFSSCEVPVVRALTKVAGLSDKDFFFSSKLLRKKNIIPRIIFLHLLLSKTIFCFVFIKT